MKRPAFQFYPGDWTRNSNLRRCTHAEKGIWLEVLCLMHDSDEYGILRWPLKEIAEAVKCKPSEIRALVSKGVLKGSDSSLDEPFIYTPRSGRKDGDPVTLLDIQSGPIWYSSRMVKDEHVRINRGDASRFGEGNGEAPKDSPKPIKNDAPKPPFGDGSSSASASATAVKNQNPVDTAACTQPESRAEPSDAAADAIHSRSIELTALLRKRGAALQASDPRVQRWAKTGISDAAALGALEVAQSRRAEKGDASPVNAGYLDAILTDLGTNRNGHDRRETAGERRERTIAALTGRDNADAGAIDGTAERVD